MTAEFEKFKDAARKQFGSATAFRVGIVVGRQGGNPLHPYPAGSGRLKSYLDGLAFGAEQREKAAKETSMQAEQQSLHKMLSIYVEQLRENPSLQYVRLTMAEAERLIAALSHPSTPQGAEAPKQEPFAWLVCSVNSDGALSLEYAAPWREAAHEHINDAITEHGIEGASSWVVRPAYLDPQPDYDELEREHMGDFKKKTGIYATEQSLYRIDYDNDTGPNDEGFEEWWSVVDERSGDTLCKCSSESDAKMIRAVLATQPTASNAGERELTLGKIAREAFDDYWHEDSKGIETDAWEQCAQAVAAAVRSRIIPPCESCFGTGVDGDAGPDGQTIDIKCGDCDGTGRAALATKPPAGDQVPVARVTSNAS